MHMKELPMFTYNSWMDCLHPEKSCQLFCPVINIARSNNLYTLMCTLHNFPSNKARFIHTSTVTCVTEGDLNFWFKAHPPLIYLNIDVMDT